MKNNPESHVKSILDGHTLLSSDQLARAVFPHGAEADDIAVPGLTGVLFVALMVSSSGFSIMNNAVSDADFVFGMFFLGTAVCFSLIPRTFASWGRIIQTNRISKFLTADTWSVAAPARSFVDVSHLRPVTDVEMADMAKAVECGRDKHLKTVWRRWVEASNTAKNTVKIRRRDLQIMRTALDVSLEKQATRRSNRMLATTDCPDPIVLALDTHTDEVAVVLDHRALRTA